MSDEPKPVPPPGSDLALDAGCICPIYDNRHGAGMYEGPDGPLYVVNSDCPLHGGGMVVLPQDAPLPPVGCGITPLPEAGQ